MADGLNRVTLLGNLGADPDFIVSKSGGAILKLRIATSETYFDKTKQKQERVEWHSVVIFGKRAEALSKFLDKGKRVLIEGSLRTSSYEDKSGNKRTKTEIAASNIILLGGKGDGSRGRSVQDDDYDPASAPAGYSGHSPDEVPDRGAPDDDIPFAPLGKIIP